MKRLLSIAILLLSTISFSQSREDFVIKDSLSAYYFNHTYKIIDATITDPDGKESPSQGDFVGKLITVKTDRINYVDLQVEGKRIKRYVPKIEDGYTVMRMENDLETELEIISPNGISGEFYASITIRFKGAQLDLNCLQNPKDDPIKVRKIISDYYKEINKPKTVGKSTKHK